MKIAIIVVSCIMGYGFMAGLTFGLIDRVWKFGKDRQLNDNPAAVVMGTFWPIGLPCGYAIYLVTKWGKLAEQREKVTQAKFAAALKLSQERGEKDE